MLRALMLCLGTTALVGCDTAARESQAEAPVLLPLSEILAQARFDERGASDPAAETEARAAALRARAAALRADVIAPETRAQMLGAEDRLR